MNGQILAMAATAFEPAPCFRAMQSGLLHPAHHPSAVLFIIIKR
jgi:hypothetical protein